jgi:hypothetical protein
LQWFKKAPAPIYKLGHVGMCVTGFPTQFEFYTTHFNFLPSDLIHHSSFETHNFYTRVLGHDWLRHKGYELTWETYHGKSDLRLLVS